MYELIRLAIPAQAEALRARYGALVPQPLHGCFAGQDPQHDSQKSIIAIAATYQAEPVGIVLASCGSVPATVEVHHLYVLPEHRNKQLGRQLLGSLQTAAESAGGRYFFLVYPSGEPTTPAIEKVLAAIGWKGKRPFMVRCHFEMLTFDVPWVHTPYCYTPEFEEFPWAELTATERQDLLKRQHQGFFKGAISPFKDEATIEPLNSLGLRHQGRVVGCMITHRLDPDTIRYTALYIEPGLPAHKLGPKLVFNAVRLHMHAPTTWSLLEMPLLQVRTSWARFIENRLVPYAYKVNRLVQAWHVTN